MPIQRGLNGQIWGKWLEATRREISSEYNKEIFSSVQRWKWASMKDKDSSSVKVFVVKPQHHSLLNETVLSMRLKLLSD